MNVPSGTNRAAIAFGRHTLDEAVVPSDAASFTGPAPPGLQCPFLQGAVIGNRVFAHRFWTVNEAPHALAEWLAAHVPHGFVADGGGTLGGGVVIWNVDDHLAELPANISEALLQLDVVGPTAGPAVLRIDSTVGWTAPRPADEFVSTRDRVVVVTVIHLGEGSRTGKRVVVSDAMRVQRIASDFNHLTVEPPPGANSDGGCQGPISADPVVYQAAFDESATAAPALVATVGDQCVGVAVTIKGRAALNLNDEPHGAVELDLAHVLGLAEPDFG